MVLRGCESLAGSKGFGSYLVIGGYLTSISATLADRLDHLGVLRVCMCTGIFILPSNSRRLASLGHNQSSLSCMP